VVEKAAYLLQQRQLVQQSKSASRRIARSSHRYCK